MLFADDAALVSHTEDGLQQLVSRLAHACKEFGLKISLKKTNVMAQDTAHPPVIDIDGYNLEAVDHFTYLGSTISSSLAIDVEINSRIAKAAAAMAKLNQRVWTNHSLTENTRIRIYQACVLSTLLYGSESLTTYARHEHKLNSCHLRWLRRILQIKWQDMVSNTEVLERANMRSMHVILCERRLRWLGHVRRMNSGRIPKDMLYGELSEGSRRAGRPKLRFKDVCKSDMKRCNIDVDSWESVADNRPAWKSDVKQGIDFANEARTTAAIQKRTRRKERQQQPQQPTTFCCTRCGRDCHSRVGLHSHTRKCRQ